MTTQPSPYFFHNNYEAFKTYEQFHITNWIDQDLGVKSTSFWSLERKAEYIELNLTTLVNNKYGTNFTDNTSAQSFFEEKLSTDYGWDFTTDVGGGLFRLTQNNFAPSKTDMLKTAKDYLKNTELLPSLDANNKDKAIAANIKENETRLAMFEEACAVVKDLDPDNAATLIGAAEKRLTAEEVGYEIAPKVFKAWAGMTYDQFKNHVINGVDQYWQTLTDINTWADNQDDAYLTGLTKSSYSAQGTLNATSAQSRPDELKEFEKYIESFLRLCVTAGRYKAFTIACEDTAKSLESGALKVEGAGDAFFKNFNNALGKANAIPDVWLVPIKANIGVWLVVSLGSDIANIAVNGWSAKNSARLTGDFLYAIGLPGFFAAKETAKLTLVTAQETVKLSAKAANFIDSAWKSARAYACRDTSSTVAAEFIVDATTVARTTQGAETVAETTATGLVEATTLVGRTTAYLFSAADIAIGIGQIINGNNNKATLAGRFEIAAGASNIAAGLAGFAAVAFAGTLMGPTLGAAFFGFTAISFGMGLISGILDSAKV